MSLSQTAIGAENSVEKILILGDSLSAAHNIPVEKSWPELFSTSIKSSFPHLSVVNASISGETTFGGIQRLHKLLTQYEPSHLIIELGGNDGLRGLDFSQTTENLSQMVEMALQNNTSVLLIGVRLPPNLGVAYNQRFQQIFENISTRHQIFYLPRFLEGVAGGDSSMMQNDGIHPSVIAQPVLAGKVFNAMLELLSQK